MKIHRDVVSMIGEARDAQWTPERFLGVGAKLAIAPAKVNLLLAVGERDADGYHELTTVFHALALNDRLYCHRSAWDGDASVGSATTSGGAAVGSAPAGGQLAMRSATTGGGMRVGSAPGGGQPAVRSATTGDQPTVKSAPEGASAGAPSATAIVGPDANLLVTVDIADRVNPTPLALDAADNIVVRALDALARVVRRDRPEKIAIHLEKSIPTQAGLGGGSSDAAAALAVAAGWWGVDRDDPRVLNAANEVGSDVAFFLRGGCGVYGGRGGERVRALKPASTTVVLVKPEVGVSTAAAYATFDDEMRADDGTRARQRREAIAALDGAQTAADIPLFNNLESAAYSLCGEAREVRCWMASQPGVRGALLSGSGSATFALMEDLNAANALASGAGARGWWSRVTTLAPWGVSVRDA